MVDARKPRMRSETLRITTTVIDTENLFYAVNHFGNEFFLPEQLCHPFPYLTFQRVHFALLNFLHRSDVTLWKVATISPFPMLKLQRIVISVYFSLFLENPR
jgi:hypothetical protein